jgi:hypothetical protein
MKPEEVRQVPPQHREVPKPEEVRQAPPAERWGSPFPGDPSSKPPSEQSADQQQPRPIAGQGPQQMQQAPFGQAPQSQQQLRPPVGQAPQHQQQPPYGQYNSYGQYSSYGQPQSQMYGQYGQYGGQHGQYSGQQYGQQPAPGQQQATGQLVQQGIEEGTSAVKEALGKSLQSLMGFGNRTKEAMEQARDSVVTSATAATQTLSARSTSKFFCVKGMSKMLETKKYSLTVLTSS